MLGTFIAHRRAMTKPTILLSFLIAAASCVSDSPEEIPEEAPVSGAAEFQDGDDGEGVPVQRPALPNRDSTFTISSPCADNTVDVLTLAPNHTVAFCDTADESTLIIETAPFGHPDVVPEGVRCAAQLYAQLAPTKTIPKRLLARCTEDEMRQSVRPISLDHLPQDGAVDDEVYSHYCGNSGATEFQQERCYGASSGSTLNICRSTSVSWHQRTCKTNVGDWCSHAKQTIASCGGSTRFQIKERKRFRNTFNTFSDFDVQSGYWSKREIVAGKRTVLFGWYDWDFRMIGDSYGSANHRYAVSFRRN